ncbi:hypothetical protein HDG34_003270 [Paraburkholderia sp. HC6.4b]|nr:hypothetical protein [Paraburkholderia sp. HC6.4b]MBB5451057.1 hypothetical protein [Paraburkholderia sp. Kb1A]
MLCDEFGQPGCKAVPVKGHVLNQGGLTKHGGGFPGQRMATTCIKQLQADACVALKDRAVWCGGSKQGR